MKRTFIAIAAMAFYGAAFAEDTDISVLDNTLYIEHTTLKAGEQDGVIMVNMKNVEANIQTIGVFVNLPEGVKVVEDEFGLYIEGVETRMQKIDRRTLSHTLSKSFDEGVYKVGLLGQKEFTGTDGAVFEMHVTIDPNLPEGDYTIEMTEVQLTRLDDTYDQHASVKSTLTVTSDNPNSLFYTDKESLLDNKNIIKGDKCDNFIITDRYPINILKPFTAAHASYSRQMSNEWGTVCLPIALESNDKVQYYTLKAINGNMMSFQPVTTVEAGTPAVVRLLSGDVLSVDASDVAVTSGPCIVTTEAVGWTMSGTYAAVTKESNESDIYYIAQNEVKYANQVFPVAPFRAWFETSKSYAIKEFLISLDDDATAITPTRFDGEDVIFNISGLRLSKPQKGINIINGKKVQK